MKKACGHWLSQKEKFYSPRSFQDQAEIADMSIQFMAILKFG